MVNKMAIAAQMMSDIKLIIRDSKDILMEDLTYSYPSTGWQTQQISPW